MSPRGAATEGGISIPYKYTSSLAPIMTPKLWNDVKVRRRDRAASEPDCERACVCAWAVSCWQAHGDLKSFETPYVVKLFKHMQIARAKDCFTFVHPNPEVPIDNSRYACMRASHW